MSYSEFPPVKKLIPQREPMLCVDTMLSFAMESCSTDFLIPDNHIFVNKGHFLEAGLIENMAQSCAVRIGYIEVVLNHNPSPRIGLIGAVKHLSVRSLPPCGSKLETMVVLQTQWGDMSVMDCRILCREEEIASCSMVIALS